jgi:hypothetical protein
MRDSDSIVHQIEKIVHVSTNVSSGCLECGGAAVGQDRFAASVNHYLEEHGYVLLHVGQETDQDAEGRQIRSTVAVIGLPGSPLR